MSKHHLVGYDRKTEHVADQYLVPEDKLPQARVIAGVPDDDPDVAFSYELEPNEVRGIADLIGARVGDPDAYYFSLEGSAD
jgi:hypothetical protein